MSELRWTDGDIYDGTRSFTLLFSSHCSAMLQARSSVRIFFVTIDSGQGYRIRTRSLRTSPQRTPRFIRCSTLCSW
jgi:hypothetical protein